LLNLFLSPGGDLHGQLHRTISEVAEAVPAAVHVKLFRKFETVRTSREAVGLLMFSCSELFPQLLEMFPG
jgi:hypothetical protein